jgi:hypothetical protein
VAIEARGAVGGVGGKRLGDCRSKTAARIGVEKRFLPRDHGFMKQQQRVRETAAWFTNL